MMLTISEQSVNFWLKKTKMTPLFPVQAWRWLLTLLTSKRQPPYFHS